MLIGRAASPFRKAIKKNNCRRSNWKTPASPEFILRSSRKPLGALIWRFNISFAASEKVKSLVFLAFVPVLDTIRSPTNRADLSSIKRRKIAFVEDR